MLWMIATLLVALNVSAAEPIPVRISFIEAISPVDTTASERFQKDFEFGITQGSTAVKKRLADCGYKLESDTSFYAASDPLQAHERAAAAQAKGTWLIVGSRRSNHYLLLTQGAPEIPTLSLMASSSEVAKLGPRHLSLSPLNEDMAQAAAREATRRARSKGKSFLTIVSSDCATCVDFANRFTEEAARLGFKEGRRLEVVGETPQTAPLIEAARTLKPSFLLLPNYSKVSSLIMNHMEKAGLTPLYVGSDGWGDANFGFVQDGSGTSRVQGFTVRGFPPPAEGLKRFGLGRALLKGDGPMPKGVPAMAVLKALDGMADLICRQKPTTREKFTQVFEKAGAGLFSAPWGVSVYELRDGQISYSKPAGKGHIARR